MNDPVQIEAIVLEREKRYIGLTESISSELFNILVQTTPAIVASLFKKKNPNSKQIHKHDTTMQCSVCRSKFTCKALTIAQVQNHIRAHRDYYGSFCAECQKERDIWNKEERERQQLKNEQIVEGNTKHMIEVYLNPNNSWKSDSPHKERFKSINYYQVNDAAIKEYINQMDYMLFLQTPYWKAIAQEVRKRAKFTCKQCKSSKNLAVHHTTYKNHGNEHGIGFYDLVCLCDKCHKREHNIEE